jgi:hypothetical protein
MRAESRWIPSREVRRNGTPAAIEADRLVEADPYECSACRVDGELCAFHAGFAEGWDACACFVARTLNDHFEG